MKPGIQENRWGGKSKGSGIPKVVGSGTTALFPVNFSRLQCINVNVKQFWAKLKNCPKLPHIHIQIHCHVEGEKGYCVTLFWQLKYGLSLRVGVATI